MTGHLARLAARATAPAGGGLRPRLPSLFEQPAGLRAGDPAGVRPAEAGGASPGRMSGAATTRVHLPEAGLPGTGPPTGGLIAAGLADERRRPGAPDTAGLGRAEGPGETAGPAETPRSAESPAPTERPGPGRTPLPRSTLRTRQPGGASPFREEHATTGQPADSTDPPADAHSSARTGPEDGSGPIDARPGSSSAPVSEQVLASLVAEALTGGLRSAADRDGTAYDGAATPREGVPPAEPAGPRAVPLPRLQTGRSPDTGRRERRPTAPEVTVNIGRIEVVPPPPAARPAAPRPRPPSRASGAPALADYLRDRSRR